MIEKYVVFENIDPVVFYRVDSGHLQVVKSLFPRLRIAARDNVIRILGDEEEMVKTREDVETMRKHVERYDTITEEDILDIVRGRKTKADTVKDVLIYSVSGEPIKSHSEHQQQLIGAFEKNDMILAVRPAGAGKTYLGITLAVKALKEKIAKKIILSHPTAEAGEKLDFLPGDMENKVDPYLQSFHDALEGMIPAVKPQDMTNKHIIQIAPLAFIRSRALSDAVITPDGAQNTTPAQIRMFLTRMGWDTKMIITGDPTQIDLLHVKKNGLKEALSILNGVDGVSVINLDKKDIIGHKLVTRVVNAYGAHDKANKRQDSINIKTVRALTKAESRFDGQKSVHHGKVRDVHDINDDLIVMVATGRISAFDVVLPKGIPSKRQVLNQITAKFLDLTTDICPNWRLTTPDPMVTVGLKCEGFRAEMIIRSILTGSAWRACKDGCREIYGVKLPGGVRENEYFPEPIVTPTTKADKGHDINIPKGEIIEQGIVSAEDYAIIKDWTRKLFARDQEIATKQGLILADTKYEFGKRDGQYCLTNEIHTPDSSRYFYAEGYEEELEEGEPQKQLSKEFLRQWPIEHNSMNEPGQTMPEITDECAETVNDCYIELYEHIMGEKFDKAAEDGDIAARIRKSVKEYLASRK